MILTVISPKEATKLSNALLRAGIANNLHIDPNRKLYEVAVRTSLDNRDIVDKIRGRYDSVILKTVGSRARLQIRDLS